MLNYKMETTEYIEYCEDEIKTEIKPGVDDKKLSQKINYSEYFKEDVKEEIEDEMEPQSNLVKHLCDICSKTYKSKDTLKEHMQSVHRGQKYPCDQCVYKASRKQK